MATPMKIDGNPTWGRDPQVGNHWSTITVEDVKDFNLEAQRAQITMQEILKIRIAQTQLFGQ